MITKNLMITLFTICLLLGTSLTALGSPSASMLYTETDLGGGTWQYDYTFYNSSDATESLYSVFFYFAQSTTFNWVNIPSGWDSTLSGFTPINTTLADTYSTGLAYDIGAGNSLGLFSFTVDNQIGDISYDAYLSGDNVVSGTTTLVPEPISLTLFVMGAGVLAGRRYLRKK